MFASSTLDKIMQTPKTPHQIAAEIASINAEVVSYLRAQAQRSFALVNTAGQEQAVLDAFPALGLIPAQAVGVYAALRAALDAVGYAEGLPEIDPAVFVVNEDGSVTFVAPREAEPEE